MTTTLNKILAAKPCTSGWQKLLRGLGKTKADDEPLSFVRILEINGLDDAVWALRTCDDEMLVRTFAVDCAEHVLHIYDAYAPGDNRVQHCIDVTRAYIRGEATLEELDVARAAAAAAAAAADAAAYYAADAAADAAYADAAAAADAAACYAAYAAANAARAAERAWQEQRYRELFVETAK